jgi:hypothetical protein
VSRWAFPPPELQQTLHGEISESERISHPFRYEVQQRSADNYSQRHIVAEINAQGIILPEHMPSGSKGLVHRRKVLGS